MRHEWNTLRSKSVSIEWMIFVSSEKGNDDTNFPLDPPLDPPSALTRRPFSVKALAAEGWLRRFLVLVGTLTAWKKGERQACSDHWVREMLPKKMWIFGVKDLHQGPQQNARMWDATDHKTRSQSRAPSSNNTENEEGWQRLQHHQSPCYPFTPPMQC